MLIAMFARNASSPSSQTQLGETVFEFSHIYSRYHFNVPTCGSP
jgi:hypothetical protein